MTKKNPYLPDPDDHAGQACHASMLTLEKQHHSLLLRRAEEFWFSELLDEQRKAATARSDAHEILDLLLDTIHEHASQLRQIKARKGI